MIMVTEGRKSDALKELRGSVETLIFDSWNLLHREGALQSELPEGWSCRNVTYYDGGSITLSIEGHDVATIERDVEFHRISIAIKSPFDTREGRVLGMIRTVVENLVEHQQNADRQAALEAEIEKNARALAYIDDLPDPTVD